MIEMQNIKLPKFIGTVFFLLLTLLAPTIALAEGAPTVRIAVEGRELPMPVAPVIVQDRTMVAVRSVTEAVGGEVAWDPDKRQVTVKRFSDTILLTIGSNQALVNGKAVELEVAPQIVQDRTMVPLRFIAEALGATVEWNGDTRTVNILRKPSAITAMTYSNTPEKATVTLTFSEPLLGITPQKADQGVAFGLYPAQIALNQPERIINDNLLQKIGLQADGRTVRFEAQLWYTPRGQHSLSPDGKQLTLEFAHSVTGYSVLQDRRATYITIGTTGKLAYTTFALNDPPRIVVDLPAARMEAAAAEVVPNPNPHVRKIRAADRGADGTRIVLDMAANLPYEVVATDSGLRVELAPRILAVKTEKLQGTTRLTFTGSLPMDATVTADAAKRQVVIQVPQGKSALTTNLVKVADGTVDSISVAPGAQAGSTTITVALPYYLGHTVLSKPGDSNIIVDIVSSPVFGKRIWVDAGHGKIPGGKDDPGTIGKTTGIYEKNVNLQVSLELQRRLQEAGATVLMTRTGDEGIDFVQRPAKVNAAKPAVDLFVSVHHNSTASNTVRGIETYYWTTNPKSRTAAGLIHPALVKGLGFPDRKVRQEAFFVIKEVKAPAVLLELGYLSNEAEEKAISDKGYPAKAAEAIKNGIFDYFWQEIRAAVAN